MSIEKIEIKDPTGILSNITDLMDEVRNGNIEALSIVYARKDGSTRTFWSGWDRIPLIGILEQLKFDLLMAAMPEATVQTFGDSEE